jgi:two-component system CheB/CheR fusion protein
MDDNERAMPDFPPASPGYTPSKLPFFVVGIGASAGGLVAISRFIEAMPADNGMAFVIVVHLSPEHESELANILQRKTRMPVLQVTGTLPIEPNHVYIIPPKNNLLMNDGHLQPVPAVRPNSYHGEIDLFLRTLAEVHRERAVGIIFSGAGADGAVGISRIKEKGGVAIAQSLDDAEYDSMPRSAIDTGLIDIILPAAEIPQRLIALVHNAEQISLPEAVPPASSKESLAPDHGNDDAEAALHEIMKLLRQSTGHDFRYYKRATVLRRIERRLQIHGLPDVIAYQRYIEEHPGETAALLQDMLISVTNFFRDRAAFEALERDIIPAIFDNAGPTEQIRCWSVACATGEEAYSIAMLMADQNALSSKTRMIQVFASDIDERAVNFARHGQYPESIATDITPGRLRQYFTRDGQQYRISDKIRQTILFSMHNILRDPPFSRLHLVTCRNLLIYLERDIQKKVLEVLHYALQPGGYLFLGSAETAEIAGGLFVPVDKKHRIYRATHVRTSSYPQVPQPALSVAIAPVKAARNRAERRKVSPEELHRRFVEDAMPPSILIDDNGDIVYVTSPAGRFLHYPHGELSKNILSLVQPELRLELSAALFQSRQTHEEIHSGWVRLLEQESTLPVRMLVRPGKDSSGLKGTTLVVFEESSEKGMVTVSDTPKDNAALAHLERELGQTKEELQSVIEQYETALEDSKASNEELQAMNEELRSATEEMETSKEELQSINEELNTVNAELKMKVEETSKANDDLENFVAATEIATIFIDRGMRIKRYTKPAAGLFNLIPTDIDRPLLDITNRLEYPRLRQHIEQVFEKLQPVEREVRGTEGQWYIARLLPYRTAEHHIDGVVLTFIDISWRKAVEERLYRSEQQMRLIAACTQDYAITTMDMDGKVTSWNSGAHKLFGYTEQEITGQTAAVLYTPEDNANRAFQEELQQALKNGRVEDDRWHMRKDGSRVFCSGITFPLSDGELRGYVKIARDLTGNKHSQDQRDASLAWEKQERIRAEEAARVRDEFFAVLSHELKQPLNLIQLTAEMMSRLPESAKLPAIVRGAATIKRTVESQAKIIDDLMDLSRLHTGKLTLVRSQINFSEAVAHVVGMMKADAQQRGVSLVFEPAPKDLIIHGDIVRIEQIVWNLLSNALKFTPAEGRVHVRLRQENDVACLEVADTGKGIAPEFLPYVFDMFRQADSGTTRQYGGMGIGLALVKELVASHGGRIDVHSEGAGKGASFQLSLPTAVQRHTAAPAVAASGDNLTGKRILVVDDGIDMLESLAGLLGMEGAIVATAASGPDAIALAQQAGEPFHLIVSDIGMPGMDGHALLAELRKLAATAETPAIALSGFTRPKDVDVALAAGFESHVRKPVAFEQFIVLAKRMCA